MPPKTHRVKAKRAAPVEPTVLASALATSNVIPIAVTGSAVSIASIGAGLPPFQKKSVYRAIVSSLNWTIVNQLKQHFASPKRGPDTPEGGGIDAYNDMLASIDEAFESELNTTELGYTAPMPPMELARHYHLIRAWLHQCVRDMETQEKLLVNYAPMNVRSLGFADTLKSMLAPAARVDEQTIAEVAKNIGMEIEHVREGLAARANRDRVTLMQHVPAIIEALKDLDADCMNVENAAADDAFDALPFLHQMRLMHKIVTRYDKQASYATADHLQGRDDAMGTYRLILAAKNELLEEIHEHMTRYPNEMLAYTHVLPVFEKPLVLRRVA